MSSTKCHLASKGRGLMSFIASGTSLVLNRLPLEFCSSALVLLIYQVPGSLKGATYVYQEDKTVPAFPEHSHLTNSLRNRKFFHTAQICPSILLNNTLLPKGICMLSPVRDPKMNKRDLRLPGTKCRDTQRIPGFTILYYPHTEKYGILEDRHQRGLGVGSGWQRGFGAAL